MTGYILLDAPNNAQPQGTYPRRGSHKPSGTAIVHTSEGNWRSGVDGLTRLVQTRADWGCYHQACDWQDIARYYPWEWETWQDTETNNWAVGIAAACKTSDWGNMPADIEEGYYRNLARMAADFVAYMGDVHGVIVPLRRISGADARSRKPGFAAHGDSGVARSDPGVHFDWPRFFAYTAQALGGIAPQGSTITPLEEDDMFTDQDRAVLNSANIRAQIAMNEGTNAKVAARENLAIAAQISNLIGAIAALSKGEPFDEAKLLAGVQAAAEAGVKNAIDSIETTITVKEA